MEKIWFKNYHNSIPHEIQLEQYSSLLDLFLVNSKKYENKIAYSNFGTDISYKLLETYTRDFAAFLQNTLKLKKGDRIAIMLPNVMQFPLALFSAFRLGLVVVNVNPLYTAQELAHQINDSSVETIVVLENFAHTVAKVLGSTCLRNIIITKVGDLHGFPKKQIMNFVNKYIKKSKLSSEFNKFYYFSDCMKLGSKQNLQDAELTCDDIAFLQYTGGTTGVAKGAVLLHKNILANIAQASLWVKPILSEYKEIVITALPLYHIFSLLASGLVFFLLGAQNILITDPRDIKRFVGELKKHKFSVIMGVNTLFNALIKYPPFAKLDFSNLKISLSGGMTLHKNIAEKWHKITGCYVLEAYGLTEASPAVTITPLHYKHFTGSVGLPIPSTVVSIRDLNGQELGIGERGELWVKGPQVMKEYWNNPKETSTVFQDGWLKTGDIAYIDEGGHVYIVDRIKDLIVVSGFNVYPIEVEDVLLSHPDVLEAGVIGDSDENGNEIVVAFVVIKNPKITSEHLKTHCATKLTKYKIPKKIYFIPEFPKSNIGKVLRKELKKMLPK